MASDAIHLVVSRLSDTHKAVSDHLKKVDPLWLVIGAVGGTVVYLKISRLYRRSEEPLVKRLAAYAFSQFRRLPTVRARIEKELAGAKKEILETIHKDDTDRIFLSEIPANGLSTDAVVNLADRYDSYGKFDIAEGEFRIYAKYAYSNPLHPDIFPGARKMEAETIRMVLNLYNAPSESSGSLTTGGTESIIMACIAYRNRAMQMGVESPVIVCSVTAHAAFDKAAFICGMRIRHIPVDENNRVNLSKMENAIDSDLGKKYNIPVHVDACLGGFLIPFMDECGFDIPVFDFRNEVWLYTKGQLYSNVSIKGVASLPVLLCSRMDWWYLCHPTICGSRAGANSAAAWATLLSFGKKEYRRRCHEIVSHTRKIAAGLHGSPDVSVVAFKSSVFNIYAVSDKMNKRGWNLNTLQNPNAIHICLTYNHASQEVVDAFLRDLKEVADEVSRSSDKGNKSSTAALYGMAAQIPDKSLVDEMTYEFLDACYAKPPLH
ncbi:pyridoxal-dependent decarboxylase domain protein [Ostertagia ostertagi]